MNDRIKAGFGKDEIALCAAIAQRVDDLSTKVAELFEQLPDPLLSAEDIAELLQCIDNSAELQTALDTLSASGTLEYSDDTQRPLDKSQVRLYRAAAKNISRLKLYALDVRMPNGSSKYLFNLDGRLVRSLAKVDRLDAIAGTGQQRDEIVNHVKGIAESLADGTDIPNPILLTMDSATTVVDPADEVPESFIVIRGLSELIERPSPADISRPVQVLRTVEIDFPYRQSAFDEEKGAMLVDGQQRTAAISIVDLDLQPTIPVSAVAIVADSDSSKRIFQIANSTQKISTQFSRALLASMEDAPPYLRTEQIRAQACRILSLSDKESPFYLIVKYPGAASTRPTVLAYNSIFQVVTTFAESGLPVDDDARSLAQAVSQSYALVRKVWPEAWDKKPGESKLMHGAGLRAMAQLIIDLLFSEFRSKKKEVEDADVWNEDIWTSLEESLRRLRTVVLWTDEALKGTKAQQNNWQKNIFGKQNTNQDIAELASFLKKESLSLEKRAARSS